MKIQLLIIALLVCTSFAIKPSDVIYTVNSPQAPAPIGPYSQAKFIEPNYRTLYTSGQIGIDPKTGNLVSDDVTDQTIQIMQNLDYVLRVGGSSFEWVFKAMVFLDDMDNFDKMNAVYAQYFSKSLPARSCVQVAKLPKGAKVEIELIAILRPMMKEEAESFLHNHQE